MTQKQCLNCGLRLEGNFEENPLTMLTSREQDFLLEFILVGGNFKALGEKLNLTYPTLRSYLDKIIERLNAFRKVGTSEGIIDAIDRGEITPDEGIKKLRKFKEV